MMTKKIVKSIVGLVILGIIAFSLWQGGDALIQMAQSEQENINNSSANMKSFSTNPSAVELQNDSRGITITELSSFNGKNGKPAYIAVEGVVYDMTDVSDWKDGKHYGLTAGQDLTKEFAESPHAQSILEQGERVAFLTAEFVDVDSVVVEENSADAVIDSVILEESDAEIQVNQLINSKVLVTSGTISVFTEDTLKQYDGLNGRKAYIAVDGKVYDVTHLGSWSGGDHKGYVAGLDLTTAFKSSPHSQAILESAVLIGSYSRTATNVTSNNTNQLITEQKTTVSTINQTENTQKTTTTQELWTLDKLKSYNGQNQMPAYIAVNSTIYDVTALGSWSGGSHKGYQAGADLTNAFAASPHASSILRNAPIIGTLGEEMNVDPNPSSNNLPTGTFDDDHDDDDDDDDHDDDDDDDDHDDDDDDDDHDHDHDDDDDDHDDDD